MSMVLVRINWLAVLVAFVPYFLLGALWFTVFFKKQYAESLGKTTEQQQNTPVLFIAGPALCTLIITAASGILMAAIGIEHYSDVMRFALVVGFGYLVSNTVNISINPNIPRPIYYGAISGTYHIVGIFIATTILFLMK